MKKNRDKYDSYWEYVLESPEAFKILITMSVYFPVTFLTFLTWIFWFTNNYEMAFVMGAFLLLSIYTVIKFHKNGGFKRLPNTTAGEFVWNQQKNK